MMKRSATIAIASVAATAAIACSIVTGQWTSAAPPGDSGRPAQTSAQGEPNTQANLPDQAVSATSARLGASAQIETITYYTLCGHKTIARAAAGTDLVGRTRDQVAAKLTGGKVISFSGGLVVVEYSVPLHCPEHFILRQDEEALGVYQTVEATKEQAEVATFHLNVDVLPADIRQMLRDGMVFSSLGEIEAYLEDLDS